MAMRVVTLNRLGDYIENKLGRKQIIVKGSGCVKFVDQLDSSISCYLPNSQISGLNEETPFLKFRDQVSGVLIVCNKIVSDEEIKPYSFLID